MGFQPPTLNEPLPAGVCSQGFCTSNTPQDILVSNTLTKELLDYDCAMAGSYTKDSSADTFGLTVALLIRVIKVPEGAVLRGCKKTRRKLREHLRLRAETHSQLRVIASLFVLRIFLTCLVGYPSPGYLNAPETPAVQPPQPPDAPPLPAPCSSQAATQPAASEPGPSTPPPAKRSKPAAEPTKGKGKAKGKAAKAKPAPQPGRWVDRDCNAALNMQRIGESRWRPLELCYWPDQGALPAKGKEYPGLGYKRVRDKPPKAQEQQ
ncbi:hypothetical protein QJQ45_006698 [Haematococcus lacustris]|nr:hypothetical protein QJQ45_006698 [Haematococcus lacustris]